jgi:hypothetical protein
MSCNPPARQVGPYRPEDDPHDKRTGALALADLHVKPYPQRHMKVYADSGGAALPQGRHRQPLRVPARRPGHPGHPQGLRPADPGPAVADRDGLCDHQPHLRPGQPCPPRRLDPRALGDRRTACTTSATSPSPKTAPKCAPVAARTSWPACATSPSGRSAGRGRSTSPPPYAATPATLPGPSPLSGSCPDETDITRERRSPAGGDERDRGCPLGTGIGRSMWPAGGTAGESSVTPPQIWLTRQPRHFLSSRSKCGPAVQF